MVDYSAGALSGRANSSANSSADTEADRTGAPRVSASLALLRQVAATLDLPVGTFMEEASGTSEPSQAVLTDMSCLLAAFSRISCPVARRRCIDLVVAAGQTAEAP